MGLKYFLQFWQIKQFLKLHIYMKIRAGIRQWKLEALEEHVISSGRDYKYIEVMGLGPQMIFMPPPFFL